MIDLDKIEADAKKATPGPWESINHNLYNATIITTSWHAHRCSSLNISFPIARVEDEGQNVPLGQMEYTAQHIANMDPETTLELIAEVRRLRADGPGGINKT
jgi:hypothetical protein